MSNGELDAIGIYCAEPSHPKGRRVAVATFVRPPGGNWQVPIGIGGKDEEQVTAVLFDADVPDGQRASHKIECKDCGLSITRTDDRLQSDLNDLAAQGVFRVTLKALVAILTT